MWVTKPKLLMEFPILAVFVNCGLILSEGERAVWVSVCASVALSDRVEGITRGVGGGGEKTNLKTEKKQEIHSSHFRAPRGFGWQILATP